MKNNVGTGSSMPAVASLPAGSSLPRGEQRSRVDDPGAEAAVETLVRYDRHGIMPQLRRLSVVNPWRSSVALAAQWIVIILAVAGAIQVGHWAVYIVAGFVIGTRQQALAVLLHDAAHYLLYKNHKLNDLISDIFLTFPTGVSTHLYRDSHFRHHRHTNTDDDPDFRFLQKDKDSHYPKTRLQFSWVAVKTLLILNFWNMTKYFMPQWSAGWNLLKPLSHRPIFPLYARILFVVWNGVVFGGLFMAGVLLPVLLLYGIPLLLWTAIVNRARGTSEHVLTRNDHELNATRTVIPTFLERIIIAPFGVSYHLEHHLFPSVPGFNLPELHRLLMEDPLFRSKAHITKSYGGVLRELVP